MRLAKSNDIWRALTKSGRQTSVSNLRVTYRERADGPQLQIEINGPMALLCGENGAGKSTALRAIGLALSESANSEFGPPGQVQAPLVESATAFARKVILGDGKAAPRLSGEAVECRSREEIKSVLVDSENESTVYWYDPTIQIPYLLQLLRNDAQVDDLWAGVAPHVLSASELEDISALVGRTYSKVEIFEIVDYHGHALLPYFIVRSNAIIYSSQEMGMGELSLLFFFWIARKLTFGAVLLMEEPETFIAPKAQRALIDYVAFVADQQNIFVVASSHSAVITERFPVANISYVARNGANVTFMSSPPRKILIDRLGIVPPRSVILLVEDVSSALLTAALLEVGNSKYSSHCGIYISGSDGEIVTALRHIQPYGPLPINIIGVFDGDQRGNLPAGLKWPVVALPGEQPPEIFCFEVLNKSERSIATILGRNSDRVDIALASAGGLNHHDWIKSICQMLSLSPEELFFRIAIEYFSADAAAMNFIHEIEKKIAQII